VRNSPAATARRRRRDGNRWSPYILFDGGGTFARTGTATFVDADGIVQTAATGVRRDGHYIDGTRTLLLEPQRTNLCIRSEEFDTWGTAGVTVTANDAIAPDGTLTAERLAATTSTANLIERSVTYTANGEKCAAVFLQAGTAPTSAFRMWDNTASVTRHFVTVTWTAGVPTLATTSGAGTLYPPVSLGNGWWRILISGTGIVAANANALHIFPDRTGTTGTVYAWGAQAENAVVPSSYIPTAATTITRNADSLYFPFTAVPQAMTVYARGVEQGGYRTSGSRLVYLGDEASTNPRLLVQVSAAGYRTTHIASGGTVVESSATVSAALGAMTEVRGVVASTGAVTTGVSLNSGAETVAATSGVLALAGAWSGTRLYLAGGGGGSGQFAFTYVVVAQGEQTRATMRQLAGVA
jgi:hypothetical protein